MECAACSNPAVLREVSEEAYVFCSAECQIELHDAAGNPVRAVKRFFGKKPAVLGGPSVAMPRVEPRPDYVRMGRLRRLSAAERNRTAPATPPAATLDVMLYGASGAGKSSLLLRVADDVFTEYVVSTIGVDFKRLLVTAGNGDMVMLKLWDQDDGPAPITRRNYPRGNVKAHVHMVVFDLGDVESFAAAKQRLDEIPRRAASAATGSVRVLVGTKADLPRRVAAADAAALAAAAGVSYYETSAKTGAGVDAAFLGPASDIYAGLLADTTAAAAW